MSFLHALDAFDPMTGVPPTSEYEELFTEITFRARTILSDIPSHQIQELADAADFLLVGHPAREKVIIAALDELGKEAEALESDPPKPYIRKARFSPFVRNVLMIQPDVNLKDIVEIDHAGWHHIFAILSLLFVGLAKDDENNWSKSGLKERAPDWKWELTCGEARDLAWRAFEALEAICYAEMFARVAATSSALTKEVFRDYGRQGAAKRHKRLNALKREFQKFYDENRLSFSSKNEAARRFLIKTPREIWSKECNLKESNAARTLVQSLRRE